MKVGDIVDYGSIICKITSKNNRCFVIKSEKGNIYKVTGKEINVTTKIWKND